MEDITYDGLIRRARGQVRFKGYGNYYELHHVVPLNAGGLDEEQNLVLLTLYEHALAHFLYAIEHTDDMHLFHANINSCWLVLDGNTRYGKDADRFDVLTAFFNSPDMDYIHELEAERLGAQEAWRRKYLRKSKPRSSTSWIHRDGEERRVSNGELGRYFAEGWGRGRQKKRRPSGKKQSGAAR